MDEDPVSLLHCVAYPVLAYREVGRYVLGILWSGVFAVGADVDLECEVYRRPVDAPYPPLPGPGGSRLLACDFDVVVLTTLERVSERLYEVTPVHLLTAIYKVGRQAFKHIYAVPHLPVCGFPGSGKLTGEEFRIVEPEADYLRLVGRGGDEYLAWDLVLGTLDTGEWVLMAEDDLYKAEREGDKVVVRGPYHRCIYDVRGPPYAPFYPVVPVKWVRERLERARERFKVDVYTPPVDPEILLKWPLRNVEWEFKVYPLTYEEFVRHGPPRGLTRLRGLTAPAYATWMSTSPAFTRGGSAAALRRGRSNR